MKQGTKKFMRLRRHKRVCARISGTAGRPRFSVFRSNRRLWVQLVDDRAGRTICAADGSEVKGKRNGGVAVAEKLGELVAKKAKEKGIDRVSFDRSGYRYHGAVKALAEGARKGGLIF